MLSAMRKNASTLGDAAVRSEIAIFGDVSTIARRSYKLSRREDKATADGCELNTRRSGGNTNDHGYRCDL